MWENKMEEQNEYQNCKKKVLIVLKLIFILTQNHQKNRHKIVFL